MNEAIKKAGERVRLLLPKEATSKEEAVFIIRRYTAAIEGNFVSWMGAAAISARSVEGRYAASENLWVEMKDNHAGMLRAFAKAAGAEPEKADYQSVENAVESIRTMVAEMSGLKNLTLMAVLENTSAEFIPPLEKLAQQLGSTNLTYTKVHGEADIAHADQFTWAVGHESTHYPNADKQIAAAVDAAIKFLEVIFSAYGK